MARTCDITGKKSQVGGGYSNRTRATKFNPTGSRRRQVNLQRKTLFIPELGKKITISLISREKPIECKLIEMGQFVYIVEARGKKLIIPKHAVEMVILDGDTTVARSECKK